MKIAIEFYGHLRSFRLTADNILEKFINQMKENEVDIFIHTWNETDTSDVVWHNPNGEKRGNEVTQEDIDFLKEKYNPKKISVEPQIKLSDDENKVFKSKHLGHTLKLQTLKNVFYTRYKANLLRKEYENETGEKYDFVIQARLDLFFNKPFNIMDYIRFETYDGKFEYLPDIENKFFYCYDKNENRNSTDIIYSSGTDVIYFGVPDVMDKVCSIYERIDEIDFSKHAFGNEYLLNYSAASQNIILVPIRFYKDNFFYIIRSNGIASSDYFKKKASSKLTKDPKRARNILYYSLCFALSQIPLLNRVFKEEKCFNRIEAYYWKK